jgi:hypothetical protein
VPPTEDERLALAALGRAIDDLRRAHLAHDVELEWDRTRTVLNWLHSLDELTSARLGPTYKGSLRPADPEGRTQGALTLVRGLAHHRGARLKGQQVFRVEKTVSYFGGQALEVQDRVTFIGGQPFRAAKPETVTMTTHWRPLAELPPLHQKEKHGRDVDYAQHVEGRPLMEPLLAAQRWVTRMQVTELTAPDPDDREPRHP